MHADSVPVPGCELRDLVVDCIEVLKVYDQCVKEDVLPQQIALPGTCPNPLPPGATVDCALVFGIEAATGLPETRCEVINVGPPDVEGFADVTVRQRLVFDITIFDAFGNVLCGPTRIGPEFFFNTVLLLSLIHISSTSLANPRFPVWEFTTAPSLGLRLLTRLRCE